MRSGFTTGSCAAAAAKAAVTMLLTGREQNNVTIRTPGGTVYHAELTDCRREGQKASCAVRKDGGDDPDVTTGTLIYAEAVILSEKENGEGAAVQIEAGIGVGRVTRPGLDQPVGSAAINRVPREMIQREVQQVCGIMDFQGSLLVTISVPDGENLAEKTFNPRLGIYGGISILGTTGIVEPMSRQALLDTIRAELSVRRAEGNRIAAVTPGNYGLEFMRQTYGYDLDRSVKCSNFIGDTIDMAAEAGFEGLLLTGHIGKLVKLSGGIMNTHSKEGDCRMELLAAMGIQEGLSAETAGMVLDCVTTEEALSKLSEEGKMKAVMDRMMGRILFHLKKRAADRISVECIVYANGFGELARSAGAANMLEWV